MDGQIGIFDYFDYLDQKIDCPGQEKEHTGKREGEQILNVGDTVGKLILGDVETAKITKVEGNGRHFFYRTDKGICYDKGSRTDIGKMHEEAEQIREQYAYLEIGELDRFLAVEYRPRKCDGVKLKAMAGIYRGMVFSKREMEYQFLKPSKNAEKEYEKLCHEITHEGYGEREEREYRVLSKAIPVKRLYWIERLGMFGEARYAESNGASKWNELPGTSWAYKIIPLRDAVS